MARIRENGGPHVVKHVNLVEALVNELRANRLSGQPFIKEQEFPKTHALRVSVLWDKWQNVSDEDRYEAVMQAYEQAEGKAFKDRIAFAITLTIPEAYESGLLPFQVVAMHRRDDPVSLEQCRRAMLDEGASELFGPELIQLRFESREEAEAAVERLKKALPGSEPIWAVTEDLVRIAD